MEKAIATNPEDASTTNYIVNTLYLNFSTNNDSLVASQNLSINLNNNDRLEDNIYNFNNNQKLMSNATQLQTNLIESLAVTTRPNPIPQTLWGSNSIPDALPMVEDGVAIDTINYEANSYLCITPLYEEEITEEILNNYTYKNNHPDPQRSELIQIMTTSSSDEFSWNSLTNGITWYIMPSSMPTESGIILIGRLTFKSNINGTGIYSYNRQNYQFNIVNGRIQ